MATSEDRPDPAARLPRSNTKRVSIYHNASVLYPTSDLKVDVSQRQSKKKKAMHLFLTWRTLSRDDLILALPVFPSWECEVNTKGAQETVV